MGALLDSTVGLIYKLSADAGDAEREINRFESATDKLISSGKDGFESLSSAVSPVLVGITAVTGAATALGVKLFDLANRASEYGSAVFDASEKTGLGAESLSAYKFAADQSGTSLEQITASVAKFSRQVGEAAQGNKEATETLKRFGIDPQEAVNDLDGALGKVFRTIADLPPGIQQMTAAQAAFGKSGAELLPFIKSFDGDTQKLIQTAKELGVVLSDEDARAADAFGDTLDTLKAQASGAANEFAFGFMPEITGVMKSVSKSLATNREDWKSWGNSVANYLRGGIELIKEFSAEVAKLPQLEINGEKRSWLTVIGGALPEIIYQKGRTARSEDPVTLTPSDNKPPESDFTENKEEAEKAAKAQADAVDKLNKAQKDSIEQAFKELADITRKNYENRLISAEKYHADVLENERQFRVQLLKISDEDFDTQVKKETTQTGRDAVEIARRTAQEKIIADSEKRIADAEKLIVDSEKKITEEKKTEAEKRVKITEDEISRTLALRKEQVETEIAKLEEQFRSAEISEKQFIEGRQAVNRKLFDFEAQALLDRFELIKGDAEKEKAILHERSLLFTKLEKLKLEQKKETDEFTQKSIQYEIDKTLELVELLERRAEAERQISDEKRQQIAATDGEKNGGRGASEPEEGNYSGIGGLGELLSGSLGGLLDDATNKLGLFTPIADAITQSFGAMAQAVGNSVKAFVLFGSAGGSFRKFAAEMLASIAQMAAIQAVWNLAEGFAKLALAYFGHPTAGASATQHFIAAGVYGAIGGVAAIAGRAVAGNAFQKQTATGASNPTTGGNSGNRIGKSGAYSGFGDDTKVIESGINSPANRGGEIVFSFKGDKDVFADWFDVAFHSNGKVRKILNENYGT